MEIEECMFYPQFCRVRRVFYQSLHHIRNIDTATTTQKQEAQLLQRQRASNIEQCKRQFDILNSVKKERTNQGRKRRDFTCNSKADKISLVYHTKQTK